MLKAKVFVENRSYPRIPIRIPVGYRMVTEEKEIERILIRREKEQKAREDEDVD